MAIQFESHHAHRVLEIQFSEGFQLATPTEVATLKNQWIKELRGWHVPYTLLLDMEHVLVSPSVWPDFLKLFPFFEKFFMKKVVCYASQTASLPEHWPHAVFPTYEEAQTHCGLSRQARALGTDLRAQIHIESDFANRVLEVSFFSEVHFRTSSDVSVLRSKLMNILMQWHTPYGVLISCTNMTWSLELKNDFIKLENMLKGFFCQSVYGYQPMAESASYPFPVYRTKHAAMLHLKKAQEASAELGGGCQ